MYKKWYVIGNNYQLWDELFNDVGGIVKFPFDEKTTGFFKRLFWRICNSRRLRYPFYLLWCKIVIKEWNLKKNCTILFLNPSIVLIRSKMYEYLRKKYKARINLLMLDSVDCLSQKDARTVIKQQNNFDAIFTFDVHDAKLYGWNLTYKYYSDISYKVGDVRYKSDVLFIGYNKQRLKKGGFLWAGKNI